MKKIIIILGAILALVIVVVLGGLIYLYAAFPKADPPSTEKVEATAARLERGKYLANHVVGCIDCHSTRDFRYFGGPVESGSEGKGGTHYGEEFGFPGDIYIPNITPAAIGSWTDGELIRAITSGITKDGKALFPFMPYPAYSHMSREDLYSVVAYIRSLPAIKNDVPRSSLNFPVNLIVRTMPAPATPPASAPDTANELEYGKYITTLAGCTDCHTPSEKGEPIEGMQFAGGNAFPMGNGVVAHSANITPDKETGIGGWTKEFFIQRFKSYNTPDATTIAVQDGKNTPMPWTMIAGMTERDLGAMYTHLRTLPPVKHAVEKYTKETAAK